MVAPLSHRPVQTDPGEDGGEEGDAEEDDDAEGDVAVFDVDDVAGLADDFDVEDGEGGEEDDLEDAIECDEDGAEISVPIGQVCPDQDHGDASGDTHED